MKLKRKRLDQRKIRDAITLRAKGRKCWKIQHDYGFFFFDMQEWCEKQMEFVLLLRKKRTTKAMRAGIERHEKLEQEVRVIFSLFQAKVFSLQDSCELYEP